MKKYFIDTSLPGDEGKYFRYIILTEAKRKKYLDWFKAFDWDDANDRIPYYSLHDYTYTKENVLGMLRTAKVITPEQEHVLKKFCKGIRFDIFARLIAQHNGDDEENIADDDPVNDEENHNSTGWLC